MLAVLRRRGIEPSGLCSDAVFARRVHLASGVPVGVIDASRGGTSVETWTPLAVLREMDSVEVRAKLAEWAERVAE